MTGGAGADILNAGAGNNRLTGDAGADILNGGLGIDTFVQRSESTTPATGSTSGVTLTAGAEFTISSADIVTNFDLTDKLDTDGLANNVTNLSLGGAIAANKNFAIRGDYALSAGKTIFTTNLVSGADILVFTTAVKDIFVAGIGLADPDPLKADPLNNLGTNLTVLQGSGGLTLTGANFI